MYCWHWQVSTLVREEEEAYHAEDIVYPLRRLAANEPDLDVSLVRQSSMYGECLCSQTSGGVHLSFSNCLLHVSVQEKGVQERPALAQHCRCCSAKMQLGMQLEVSLAPVSSERESEALTRNIGSNSGACCCAVYAALSMR